MDSITTSAAQQEVHAPRHVSFRNGFNGDIANFGERFPFQELQTPNQLAVVQTNEVKQPIQGFNTSPVVLAEGVRQPFVETLKPQEVGFDHVLVPAVLFSTPMKYDENQQSILDGQISNATTTYVATTSHTGRGCELT